MVVRSDQGAPETVFAIVQLRKKIILSWLKLSRGIGWQIAHAV